MKTPLKAQYKMGVQAPKQAEEFKVVGATSKAEYESDSDEESRIP